MENSNSTIVAILGLSLTVSFVMLIMMYLLLNQIRHSIESIIAEFRKNANMQSKAFDRNFAEVNGELKKISYRLENIAEEMHRIQDYYKSDVDGQKLQARKKERGI